MCVCVCLRACVRACVRARLSFGGFYPDFGSPDGSPIRDPSLRLPPGPPSDRGFGAPQPRRPYQEEEQEEEEAVVSWRPAPPFPPFADVSRGAAPRRLDESEAPPLGRSKVSPRPLTCPLSPRTLPVPRPHEHGRGLRDPARLRERPLHPRRRGLHLRLLPRIRAGHDQHGVRR